MPVAVFEHGSQSSADDDDLIPIALLGQVQAYLAARARRLPFPPQWDQAWQRFYQICDAYIRRTAARSTRPGDLDDCVQQVWADLLISLPHFEYDRSRGGFRAFVATLSHSKAVDLIRERTRHPPGNLRRHLRLCTSHSDVDPEEACEHAEDVRRVRALLLQLRRSMPWQNFRIFYRRCVMDQATEDVAAKIGLTPEQVRFRLHRMRKRIRQFVGCGVSSDQLPEFRATRE